MATETGPRQRRSKADRRAVILNAAREVFLDFGFTGSRTRDIAKRAGITEAYLYRHFRSKEEMYEEAVLEPLEASYADLVERVRKLGDEADGTEFVRRLNEIGVAFFIDNGPLIAVVLFADLTHGRPFYREVLTPHLQAIRAMLVDRVGLSDSGIDGEVTRRAIIGAQWAIGFDYGLRGRTTPVEEIAAGLTTLFTGGVRPKRPDAVRSPTVGTVR